MSKCTIYAAFVLQKHELESNGILTHQVIKFTTAEDPAHSPYVRLDNVSATMLEQKIRKRIQGNNAYRVLDDRRSEDDRNVLMLLYGFPAEELIDFQNPDSLTFVSSHDGLTRVLFSVLPELGCTYTKLLPDIRIASADRPAVWTLTVSETQEHYELKLTQGLRQGESAEEPVHTTTAEVHVNYVRLSEFLYMANHTHILSRAMVRNCDVPPYLGYRRTCERFKFPKTRRTPTQIVRSLHRRICRTQIPLANLWEIILEIVKLFL